MSQNTENQGQASEDLFTTQELIGNPKVTEEIAAKSPHNEAQMSLDLDFEQSEVIEPTEDVQQSEDIQQSEDNQPSDAINTEQGKASEAVDTVQMSMDLDIEPSEAIGTEDEIESSEMPQEETETEETEEVETLVVDLEEPEDDSEQVVVDSETVEGVEGEAPKKKPASSYLRISELPLFKVKHIIKLDPDVKLVNSEAVYLITKATECFVRTLAKESFNHAAQQKKKTITKAHVDQALSMLPIELM